MENEQDDRPILIIDVLNRALVHYKRGFRFFVSISLVYALLAELGGFLLGQINMEEGMLIFSKAAINIFIASWASIAIIYAAGALVLKKKIDVNKTLTIARDKYALYLSVYLALLVILGCGFLLFIIPGLYLMTIFLFCDILVVCENATFRNAFRRSAQLVRPFFWKVFGYLMVVVAISLMPEMTYQFGRSLFPSLAASLHKIAAVLIMPYLMIAQVVLFYQVKRRGDQETDELKEQINHLMKDKEASDDE